MSEPRSFRAVVEPEADGGYSVEIEPSPWRPGVPSGPHYYAMSAREVRRRARRGRCTPDEAADAFARELLAAHRAAEAARVDRAARQRVIT